MKIGGGKGFFGLLLIAMGLLGVASLGNSVLFGSMPWLQGLLWSLAGVVAPMGLGGMLYISGVTGQKHKELKAKEKKVLRLAQNSGGRVNVTQLASNSDMTMEDAKATLDEMAIKGYVDTNVNEAGVIVYEFYDIVAENEISSPIVEKAIQERNQRVTRAWENRIEEHKKRAKQLITAGIICFLIPPFTPLGIISLIVGFFERREANNLRMKFENNREMFLLDNTPKKLYE